MKTKRSGMLAALASSVVLLCLGPVPVVADALEAGEESAKSPATRTPPLPPGWQVFESSEGQFRVYMPSKPQFTVGKRSTIVGSLDENRYEAVKEAGKGEAFYLVEVRDLPRVASWVMSDDGLLDSSAESLIDYAKAQNIKRERITEDGHPGITLAFDAGNHPGFFEHAKILLVGRRLYVVISGGPATAPDLYMKTFIDSFEFWQP